MSLCGLERMHLYDAQYGRVRQLGVEECAKVVDSTHAALGGWHYGIHLERRPGLRAREHPRGASLRRAERGEALLPATRQEAPSAHQVRARLVGRWQAGSLGRDREGL